MIGRESQVCASFLLINFKFTIQAMFSAFNNETSEESLTKTFKIGHRLATEENVQLLVRAMYENWLPDVMDSHAIELVQIADCYDCGSIARFAVDSLNR